MQDICDYFKHWLGTDLQLFASSASRTNLHYSVIHVDSDGNKYNLLRSLVEQADCPTIIYVSRTKRTRELAQKLTRDGISALPYNGKMDADEKIHNQDAFMSDKVRIIVATSAFGMGVDKSDVGLVIHYDISDSLENYVQEAGRAGRDPHLNAKCYVLYSDEDLDKHFILLNQTKLSISEIQQVWKAIKDFTKLRPHVSCSALEIARQAGWDDSVSDIETRVRTALSALEQSGYIERGNNIPHVYATGITVKNMDEARLRLTESPLFSEDEMKNAIRIIKSLITQKHIAKAQDSEAESRIDYLADILGLSKRDVISSVDRMRQEGILADTRDISAYLQDISDKQRKPQQMLENFAKLERYILEHIPDESLHITYKQFNDNAVHDGINTSTEKKIRTLLYFLAVKGYAHKKAKPVEEPAPAPAPKQEYVAPKPEPKPAPVEKKVEEIRRDIFFTINSYKIAPAEDAKIREVVDFLNKNTEAKVVVTGYADKGTGNDVINDRIAAKRAAAVVWMLTKKYNIPSERITEESKGARVQPFAENAKNRVTIMIAK